MTNKLLFTCLLFLLATILKAQDKPNIVFILADDLGWGDIRINNPDPSWFRYTPNIDSICQLGVRLGNYNTHCVCSPSRAGLLTAKHYAEVMAGPQTGGELPYENTMTIGKELKKNGYVTGCFGKWHNSEPNLPANNTGLLVSSKNDIIVDNEIYEYESSKYFGIGVNNYGFDSWAGYYGGGNDLFTRYAPQQKQANWWVDSVYMGGVSGYTTDLITEAAVQFIKDNKNNDFFCYVPQQAVHNPLHLKKSDLQEFCGKLDSELGITGQWDYVKAITSPVTGKTIGEADENLHCAAGEEFDVYAIDSAQTHYNHLVFGAYIYSLDKSIGRILDTLETLGLMENTIIVFTSDNGGLPHGCSLPFQGGKHSLWEGGVHVPAAVWWPEKFDANTPPYSPGNNVYIGNVGYYDIYPTLMAMSGNTFTAQGVDGINFWNELKTNTPVRTGFEDPFFGMWSNYGSVRTDEWKLIYSEATERTELYHYKTDTAEAGNLADANPEITSTMVGLYKDWLTGNKYAMPYVGLEESNIYSLEPDPAGEIMEIRAWQDKPNEKGVLVQWSTSDLISGKLGYYVEPGDRMEYDIYVAEDSERSKGIFYSPTKNDIPQFNSLNGINQNGKMVYNQELPKGKWIRNVIGYGSQCPLRGYRNDIVFLDGETGYYHFYVDNVVLRKSDGSIRSVLWKSESDVAVIRFIYDHQNSTKLSEIQKLEGFPFSDIQVTFTRDIPGEIPEDTVTIDAKVLQHLDASADSLVNTDSGDIVTSWTDLSGNGFDALPAAGHASYPSSKTFENGLDGIDFRDSRISLQLLSAEDSETILDQAVNPRGFCIITAVYIESIISDWNDLAGNSSAVAGGFLMRYSKDGKLQASLAGVTMNGSKSIRPGQPVFFSFNYDAKKGVYHYWCSAADEELTAFVDPADFTTGSPLTIGTMTNTSRYFDGMLGEVLVYDGSLAKEKRMEIISILEEKWAGELPEPPVPQEPMNLHGEPVSSDQVDLSWEQPGDSLNIAGYYVFRDGIQIAEVENNSYQDKGLNPGTSYDYFVKAFDKEKNTSEPSDTISVITLSVGAKDLSNSLSELTVYPNPAKGLLYVSLPNTSDSELRFELYSLNGSLIKAESLQTKPTKTEYSFDLSNLANGLYIYKFIGKKINSIGRIQILK
jgi:arylsulfatase A-like enzyme